MKLSSFAFGVALVIAGCTILEPNPSNIAAYCTRENGERVGATGHAYFGGCAEPGESAFLAGLARGRGLASTPAVWPYYEQMHQTETMLVAAASDAERERLRAQLRESEKWSVFILDHPGTYAGGGTSK